MKTIIPAIVIAIVIFFVFQMVLPFPYGTIFGIIIGWLIIRYAKKRITVGKDSLLNYRREDPIDEKEYCTVKDIVENDGMSQTKKAIKKRHDVYDRIIKGDPGKSKGLINKRLILVEDKNWKDNHKRKNRFKLSIYGILYAIHLFSDHDPVLYSSKKYNDIEYREKNSVISKLIKNYSYMLPLVFGKWEFLTSEVSYLVNVLINIAHISDKYLNWIYDHPLIGLRSIDVTKYKRAGIGDISEFTVLFYCILALDGNDMTRKKLSKDRDISDLYKWHLLGLKKFQKESHFRLLHAQHMLNGKYEKAKTAGKKMIELHGLSSKNFEDTFYRRLESYGMNE